MEALKPATNEVNRNSRKCDSQDKQTSSSVKSFVNLPWYDVLFPCILRKLSLVDLVHLQEADEALNEVVKAFFTQEKKLNTSMQKPEVIQAVFPQTSCLKSLFLPGATWLDDHHLKNVLELNPCLQELQITHADKLTIAGLSAIHQVKNLKILCLNNICCIEDSFLVELAETQPHLEEVNLHENNTKVTDVGLVALFTKCLRLKVIRFRLHKGMCKYNFYKALKACKELHTYDMQYDKDITAEDMRDILGIKPL